MAGILDWFNDPANQGLLAMSAGLLQAGGPSRMPQSTGQVLGSSVMQGLQATQAAKAAQAQQAMLGLHAALYSAQTDKAREEANKARRINAAFDDPSAAVPPAAGVLSEPTQMASAGPMQGILSGSGDYQAPGWMPPQAAAAPGVMPGPSPVTTTPDARARALAVRLMSKGGLEEANQALKFANEYDPETFSPHAMAGPNGVPIMAMAGNRGSIRHTGYAPVSTIPEGMRLGPNGDLVAPPGLMPYKLALANASKPTVDVKVDTGLTDNIKDIVAGSYGGAKSAVQSMAVANRVADAVSSGQINLGPTANVRQTLDQVSNVLGVGGKDVTERLANTRSVIKGMAEFSLTARQSLKGQGQISDYEGKLLAAASSGDIEKLTPPEIKVVLDVSARAAQAQYAEHQRILGVMGSQERHKPLVPYYQVPALPDYKGITLPSASPADRPALSSFQR